MLMERTATILSHRLRAHFTRLLVLETGRAAIDLYSGRLALSDAEIRAAQERDAVDAEAVADAPVRILLVGQVSAGKSSLLNAMALAVRAAVGPLPTTARVSEHRLELDGRPAVTLVDRPGLDTHAAAAEETLSQAARADLVVWVAAATQPAAPKYVNHPVRPCSYGVAPVKEVVMALAVVEGNTALIAPRRSRASVPRAPCVRR